MASRQDVDPSRVLARMRELDRRKLAAGRQAKDAQDAAQRETWRKAKRRQRAAAMQARKLAANQCEPELASDNLEKDKLYQQLFGTNETPPVQKENVIRSDLIELSRDRRAPASARVTALRTVAEIDGHIGRLQRTAGDTTDMPLASMTRQQLEQELDRLRRLTASQDAQPSDKKA